MNTVLTKSDFEIIDTSTLLHSGKRKNNRETINSFSKDKKAKKQKTESSFPKEVSKKVSSILRKKKRPLQSSIQTFLNLQAIKHNWVQQVYFEIQPSLARLSIVVHTHAVENNETKLKAIKEANNFQFFDPSNNDFLEEVYQKEYHSEILKLVIKWFSTCWDDLGGSVQFIKYPDCYFAHIGEKDDENVYDLASKTYSSSSKITATKKAIIIKTSIKNYVSKALDQIPCD